MTVPVPVHPVLRELGCITMGGEGGAQVLRLVGEIDMEVVIAFEQSGVSEARVISAVDLEKVTFLSSTGVTLLIRQTQAARDRGELPALGGLTDSTRRILQITGTAPLFRGAP